LQTGSSAVYVRQSKDLDEDNANYESRETQLALIEFAKKLRQDDNVILYDEGIGVSGQKSIAERAYMDSLYKAVINGEIGSIFVARLDRLFRDKHQTSVSLFTEACEKHGVIIIVAGYEDSRDYDFRDYSDLQEFQEAMKSAYAYIHNHIGYMVECMRRKARKGYWDGRYLTPGFCISRASRKDRQKPVIYEPWAAIMRQLFERAKELDWHIIKLIREIEKRPFLFPDIPDEDQKLYIFKTAMKRNETGGYTPTIKTIKLWFENPMLCGIWVIDQETGESIANNHPAVIERDLLEEGHIALTGENLEGESVPGQRHFHKFIDRRKDGEIMLDYRYVLQGEENIFVNVAYLPQVMHDYYKFCVKKSDGIGYKTLTTIRGEDLDRIIARRIDELSLTFSEMHENIERIIERFNTERDQSLVAASGELKKVNEQLKEKRGQLAKLTSLEFDDETLEEYRKDIRELIEKRDKLERILNGKGYTLSFSPLILKIKSIIHFYDNYPLEYKQHVIGLIIKRVVIKEKSEHWLEIDIEWSDPIQILIGKRDFGYIWRNGGSFSDPIEEKDLQKLELLWQTAKYSSELLQAFPNKTYLMLEVSMRGRKRRDENMKERIKHDFINYITWNDLHVLPISNEKIQEMVMHVKEVNKEKRTRNAKDTTLFAFWQTVYGDEEEDIEYSPEEDQGHA
jgi:hypothetical protein